MISTADLKSLDRPSDPFYIECIGGKGNHLPNTSQTLSQSPLMRKIESQMNDAITAGKDFKSGNTQVVTISDVSFVYLHGNHIASVGNNFVQLFDGGWQSVTTKSRLNALLSVHGLPGEKVFQKNFQWFVSQNGGPIPFFSGMRLAWSFVLVMTLKAP